MMFADAAFAWNQLSNDLSHGDPATILMVVFWGCCIWTIREIGKRLFRKREKRVVDLLDVPLLSWNKKKDVLDCRGLIEGGVHAFGRVGSGKTSSLKKLAKILLLLGNSSILVLCGKKGEAEEWLKYCADAGRLSDVVRFGINEPARFNMISYEAERKGEGAGQVANIVRWLMEMRSVIFRQPEGLGGDAEFWRKQDERVITHAVTLLHLAGYEITPQAIHDVIMSAPNVANFKTLPGWTNSSCNRVMQLAQQGAKTHVEAHDCMLACDYFLVEWPNTVDRTKSSILLGTCGTLTAMNTGLARDFFASTSNTNPKEQIEGRKIVIIDFPPDEWGDLGKIANIGMKLQWQKEILRRQITPDSPIACIWGDEASLWLSANDASYLSRCRSYRGCMVYICQSLDSYREVLPGEKSKSAIDAMLGCFGTKLFFALGDSTTATWAADLCGRELQQFGGSGMQYGQPEPFQLHGRPSYSANFSEQYEYMIQPGDFINGFRTGGPSNGCLVDALVVRSGVPFSNGLPVIRVTFDQRA